MTKEQYEGTPELIFYCEYNPNDFEDRLEIPFTNEYDIKLDFSRDEETKEIRINMDVQPKESNIPKDFFGKNILNVTAIAGKNGVGKSNLFKSLFINQKVLIRECLKIFLINSREIIVEISDVHNKSVLKHSLYSLFDVLINTQEDFKRSGGEYFKQRKYNSLLVSLNFNTDRVKYSKYDLSFVFGRSPAYVDASSKFWFLKEQQFGELFFQKVVVPKLTIIEIVEFIEEDKDIFINDEYYLIPADLLRSVRDENYMLLAWFYILFNINNKITARNEITTAKKNTKIVDDLSEIVKALVDFHSGHSIHYAEKYFMLTSTSPANIKQLIYSLDNCFYRLRFKVKIVNNDWILEIQDEDHRNIDKLLEQISFLNKVVGKNIIEISLGEYSSGENFILGQMASLYRVFNNEVINPEKIMEFKRFNSIIILIDEYEQHLHPEWSRKYLSYLLKFLNAEGERLGIKFQVILTTHSPYLISDLPKENIILLEKDEETGKRTARKSNYGFASNYYDIMSDNFFLDDTIGEFAKQKINDCIQAINHISDDLDKLANDELILNDDELFLFIEESLKTIEEQNKIIALIGDKFIQKQLQQLSNSVKQRLLAHGDDSVRKQQIEQDIAELEEKLRQKKMELNND